VLAVCGLAGLTWIGFPRPAVERLLSVMNRGDCFCQVGRLKLDPRGGLAASDVRVYRKGLTGPPFLDARDIRVRFRFFASGGRGRVKEIVVRGGIVSPFFLAAGHASDGVRRPDVALPGRKGMTASIRVEDSEVLGTWVERLTGDLSVGEAGAGSARFATVLGREHQRGELRGSVSWTAGPRVAGNLVSSVDPHALAALCRTFRSDRTLHTIESFSFPASAPGADVTFDYAGGAEAHLTVKGRCQASGFAYRGAGIAFGSTSGTFEWSPRGSRMNLSPLVLVLGGRNVSGNLAVDFEAGRATFEMVSTADLASVARVAGIEETVFPADWHFGPGTRVYAKGVVGYGNPAESDMEATVEGAGIGIGRIVADECSFKFLMKGVTNLLTEVRGKIGGGSFTGAASFVPEESGSTGTVTRYQVKAGIIHVDFHHLLGLFDSQVATQAEGKVYGNIELAGLLGAGNGGTAKGQGHVSVRQGCVFRIPLFGGMTEAVTKAVPGLDVALKQTELRMPFEVRDGRVRSRDLQIEGDAVSFLAKGDCGFDGSLSFDVQVRPLTERSLIGQAMRVLTYPISRLLEFRLEGSLQRPRWKPFSLVREERKGEAVRKDGGP
jgi:hypothetical protein